jgi:hypothetical protein
MVGEASREYESPWAVITPVVSKFGYTHKRGVAGYAGNMADWLVAMGSGTVVTESNGVY